MSDRRFLNRVLYGNFLDPHTPDELWTDVTPSWDVLDLSKIDKWHPGAKFVCETCLVTSTGEYYNWPAYIFWQPETHPRGSNWFAMHKVVQGDWYISNALWTVGHQITGVVSDEGEVVFSRYRHDMRRSKDGSVWIDGGRDYTRHGAHPEERFVTLKVFEDKLEIVG